MTASLSDVFYVRSPLLSAQGRRRLVVGCVLAVAGVVFLILWSPNGRHLAGSEVERVCPALAVAEASIAATDRVEVTGQDFVTAEQDVSELLRVVPGRFRNDARLRYYPYGGSVADLNPSPIDQQEAIDRFNVMKQSCTP